MQYAIDEAHCSTGEQHDGDCEDAQVICVRPIENEHRQNDRTKGDHPFHRKINGSHENNECCSNAEDYFAAQRFSRNIFVHTKSAEQ